MKDCTASYRVSLVLGAIVTVVHIVVALVTPYEFHRDEFLYMAMGRNLDLFRMDFPPFIAIASEVQRGIFGDALWSLRLLPAIAHGALVVLTAMMTRVLGGTLLAQTVAMTAVATAPLYLRAASLFQPVVFDQLWWSLAIYILLLIATHRDSAIPTRLWVALGAVAGIGLLTKFTILTLGFGVLVAMLLTERHWLRTPGPWLTALVALAVGSPSWIGQLQLGIPVLRQMGDLRESQLERIGYGEFLVDLVLMHGPPAFLLAIAGLATLRFHPRVRQYRVVGLACLVPMLAIMLLRGKPYYIGPVFPMLYAAGAVALMHATRAAVQVAAVPLVATWGLVALPLSLPISSPETTARFAARLGVTSAVRTNAGEILPLPQDYADMLGWKYKVERVAQVYHALPERERREAVIVASNYGQAGAIDFHGPALGLPDAEAPIGSYWFWGPGEKPGTVVIKVGGEGEDPTSYCRNLELAARIEDRWLVPEEQDVRIWICREPTRTLQEIWPEFRGRN